MTISWLVLECWIFGCFDILYHVELPLFSNFDIDNNIKTHGRGWQGSGSNDYSPHYSLNYQYLWVVYQVFYSQSMNFHCDATSLKPDYQQSNFKTLVLENYLQGHVAGTCQYSTRIYLEYILVQLCLAWGTFSFLVHFLLFQNVLACKKRTPCPHTGNRRN